MFEPSNVAASHVHATCFDMLQAMTTSPVRTVAYNRTDVLYKENISIRAIVARVIKEAVRV